VKNFNVAVSEERGKVILLRRSVPGGADKSYGVHVAQLAGLPKSVVHRAHEVLADLESASPQQKPSSKGKHQTLRLRSGQAEPVPQLQLFGQKSPVLEELAKLDINSLTPLEALTKLYELQKKAGEQ